MGYQNNRGGNRGGQQREKANYLRASSVTKTYHANDGSNNKEKAGFEFHETEEISFTLTPDKAQDMVNRIHAAMDDQTGTGGIRISMYGRKSENKRTGEVFDGLGMLIYAQKPPQDNNNGRGSFQQGGGRRDFPKSGQTQGGSRTTSPRHGQNTQGNQHSGGNDRGNGNNQSSGNQGGNGYANRDTQQSGRRGTTQGNGNQPLRPLPRM